MQNVLQIKIMQVTATGTTGTWRIMKASASVKKSPDSKVHWANNGAYLGPTGPGWAQVWPNESYYLGHSINTHDFIFVYSCSMT